ncbi:hypothetical protein OG21DRAFT_1525022 [Imleria badia]|nr:hypothetical protein OG21DRAFT_1525022 [Imleria badia]
MYGVPLQVHGDHGGKNLDVATWMIQHHGPNRSSFLWGWSTRNTHIERPWVDVGIHFVQHGIYVEPEIQDFDPVNQLDSGINLSEAEIVAEQGGHISHPAVGGPEMTAPFHTIQAYKVFRSALQETQEQGIIPPGYGVTKEEWLGDSYPEIELIFVGHSKQEYMVELPFEVWWPWSALWVQGLDIMTRISMIKSGEL